MGNVLWDGWCYGFKLSIISKGSGGSVDLKATKDNIANRKLLRLEHFIVKLYSNPYGNNGFIPINSLPDPSPMGGHLITKLEKNLRTKLVIPSHHTYYLRIRAIIERIFDQLKNIC